MADHPDPFVGRLDARQRRTERIVDALVGEVRRLQALVDGPGVGAAANTPAPEPELAEAPHA